MTCLTQNSKNVAPDNESHKKVETYNQPQINADERRFGDRASRASAFICGYSEAMSRMVDDAKRLDADAVVNVRFTTSQTMAGAAEMLAYGTAVKLRKL